MQFLTIKTLSLLPFVLLMPIIKLSAQTYYASPGASATWPLCSDINQPCSAVAAMANAVAGDTVYFRGGQYELYYDSSKPASYYWYRGILNPSNSGQPGNPITFMAYPNETPVMNAHTKNNENGAGAFGNNGSKSYIVFDGFSVMADNGTKMARMLITGNETSPSQRVVGNVVKNMTFNGGSAIVTSTDNQDGLRLENTTGSLIQNNKFFSYRQVTNSANTAAIKMYDNNQAVLENMEIYNSSAAIHLKDNTDDSIVRNNFLHGNFRSLLGQIVDIDSSSDNIAVYNNLIVNSPGSVGLGIGVLDLDDLGATADEWTIYNNTIVNTRTAIGGATGSWKIWNNIIVTEGASSSRRTYSMYEGNTLAQSDHNQFGESIWMITQVYGIPGNNAIYTSLAAWQASGELEDSGNPGVGSLASDPMFINASGTLSELEDFKLAVGSPSIGTGRNGVDMGVNIDTVGVYPNLSSDLIFTNSFE